ncbi:hypothetical protein ONZ43_g3492 [Nemania bipapillata]|uniref:Uncharacterized protein n=1 Tax=Nemania bipapillata TaxID=110536 RepID=A0ACC2IWN0_9PEZI|nr:hypothetical protein ONZ43_g3492 [Nemania bipapillata]
MSDSKNIYVDNTDQAAAAIKKEADSCFGSGCKAHGCEGVTKDMMDYCLQNAGPMMADFASANRDGCVQKTIVVEKMVQDGSGNWVKECQMAAEVDADPVNPRLEQSGHLGCEIYFANKEACLERPMSEWRAGRRILKVHAFLPDGTNPPHYRHEQGGEEHETTSHPGSSMHTRGRDLKVLYRCRIVTTWPGASS